MASLATFLLILETCRSVGYSMFSDECYAEKEMSCESLRTSVGYTYPVPPNMSDLSTTYCEHGWYFMNGTFLVDSALDGSKNKLKIVVDVTPENLTISTCENLQWQLHCVEYNCIINYTVTDLNTNQHKPDDNVVAMLLCIVLSSEAPDVLQCKGEKLSEGQFFFNMSYDVKENIQDCETQWLADGKVAGIYDVEGKVEFILPIVKMTEKTAILETCPERLEFLLMCPTANINEKHQCSLGFPNWSVYIWIGGGVFVVSMIVTGIIVVYQKRPRCGYAPGPANEIV
ncbi:hypothetical protein ROHU_019501 [Labeo rohita]|uniref:Uncharacterized protein n=1 Tax=Labeo rohita TaxID=84645 RepID=A0A498NDX6_LABRO|nr:hypothetical protein ROHU_019501 [Labeo rohita]